MKTTTNFLISLLLMGLFIIFAGSCKKDDVPVLTTVEVTDITPTTAKSGGNITSEGGGGLRVVRRGVCWSTSANPTIADSHTKDGSGAGSFTSILTDLHGGTTYYVRAYATNINGTTGYGNSMTFQTNKVPVLTTAEVTDITLTTAKSGGNVISDGGFPVTARGVCWSTSANPTIANSHTTDGSGSGSFTSLLTGLNPGTTYYVRAYATNSDGTGYGSTMAFQSGSGSFTDSRDGNAYSYVTIGNQVWMAENLKYLPSVVGSSTGSTTTSYYYVYGYNGTSVSAAKYTANYTTYGVLYNWTAAMAGSASSSSNPSGRRGVCPAGWHLPSDAEWAQLTDYLGGESVAGGKLKETGTAHWNSPNTGATNITGFTALPGGLRYRGGGFDLVGGYGYWWSATEDSATSAWYRYMYFSSSYVYRLNYGKECGFSVRCVKD